MNQVRYSKLMLWLKYSNHESRLGMLCLGIVMGSFLLLPTTLRVIAMWPFYFHGEVVQGKVLVKRQALLEIAQPLLASVSMFAHGGKRGPDYFIQYEYLDAAGNQHTSEAEASYEDWRDAVPGQPIAIRYLTSDPARSLLESSVWSMNSWPLGVFGLIFITSALWHGLRGISLVNRQVRLICDGEAVLGKITSARVEKMRKGLVYSVMDYEYSYLTSEMHQGTRRIPPRWRATCHEGDEILILVDAGDPTQHEVDIFDARQDDRTRLKSRGV